MVVPIAPATSAAEDGSRTLLVSIPNWVGDVVMATPALWAIRREFRAARIVHLMRPYVADVLSGTEFADEQLFWPTRSNWSGLSQLSKTIRSLNVDCALLLTNSFKSALVCYRGGCRRRIGYARGGRSWLLTDRLKALRRGFRFVPVPALDYYNDLARYAGCTSVGDQMHLATTSDDEAAVDRRLGPQEDGRPLVVLNPGANFGTAKCWPAEKYAQLADRLTLRFNARVVASLGPRERAIAEALKAAAREPIEVFNDPPLGLGPLKALIRRCRLLITNDTGPRHFAAAFGVPVVTVYGSSDPAWTITRFAGERNVMLNLACQPCMKRTCPLGHHHCMTMLEPEPVFQAATEFLSKASPLRGGIQSGAG